MGIRLRGACATVGLALASAALAQAKVTDVQDVNALSTVSQRHHVRLAPSGRAPVQLLFVERDGKGGLQIFRSDDEGATWKSYQTAFTRESASAPQLHMTADLVAVGNDVAAVYSYDTTGSYFPSDANDGWRRVYFQWWKYDGAGNWSAGPLVKIATPPGSKAYHRASIARDSAGRIWVQAWLRGFQTSGGTETSTKCGSTYDCADTIQLWVSTDRGATFSKQPDLYKSPALGGGRLVATGSKLLMLWSNYRDAPARFRLRRDGDGLASWGGTQTAFGGDPIYHGAAFNAVADGAGGIHVVYKMWTSSSTSFHDQLFYRRFDGTSFGGRTAIGPKGSWILQPAITRRGSEVYVCANQTTGSGDVGDVRYYLKSEGFAKAHVLDGSATVKAYPTAPETTSAAVPCAYGVRDSDGVRRVKVARAGGSSSGTTAVFAHARDVVLSADPAELAAAPFGATATTITLSRTGAFRETVQLSVGGLPASANAVLTPSSVSLDDAHPSATVMLEVDTGNTAPGAYDAVVAAEANGVERDLAIPLTVLEPAPAAPAPADVSDLADVTEGPPPDGAP